MAGDEESEVNSGAARESLAEQLAKLLKTLQPANQTLSTTPQSVNISTKLNQHNYSLWARLMRLAIGARGKLSHITGVPAAPNRESEEYSRWEQNDLFVCSWILENMDPEMVANYAEYPSARDLWEGLATTYSQSSGGIQIYELNVKANIARQGSETIEQFYSRLQRIWREIEARQPNPMICSEDIGTFNRLRAESKLYQFLAGIGDEFEADKRDLLKQEPLPSPEVAYATVRRERDRRLALAGSSSSSASVQTSSLALGVGSGLIASQTGTQEDTSQVFLATKPRPNPGRNFPVTARHGGGKGNLDRNRLKCTHCGKSRQSREECYHLVGFPEGWKNPRDPTTGAATKVEDTGSRRGPDKSGKAQVVTAMEPPGNPYSAEQGMNNSPLSSENPYRKFPQTENPKWVAGRGEHRKNPNRVMSEKKRRGKQ